MWNAQQPHANVRQVLDLCISSIRDEESKERYKSVVTIIEAREKEYTRAAESNNLHNILEETNVGGVVSGDEMVSLYSDKFAKLKSPGRKIYDSMFHLLRHRRCPFCGCREVSQLDHMLAKTKHPALAVTPVNLVAVCSGCNKDKNAFNPANEEEQFFHPYFETADECRWLVAEIPKTDSLTVIYKVAHPYEWSETKKKRVDNQFMRLKLANLYTGEASRELAAIKYQLGRLYSTAGAQEVALHLIEKAASEEKIRRNSWQTALYTALANSEWYCNGGFGFFE